MGGEGGYDSRASRGRMRYVKNGKTVKSKMKERGGKRDRFEEHGKWTK